MKLSEKLLRVGARFTVDAKTFKGWGHKLAQLETANARLLAVARAAKALAEETPLQDYYLYIHQQGILQSGLAEALAEAKDLL